MGYKERYQEYMCSEEWALKRTQKANEQRFSCELCGVVVLKGFHIHHLSYKNFGNEKMSDLQFLCKDCHINVHCEKKVKQNKLKAKGKHIHSCQDCYYSQVMKYTKTKRIREILWCNLFSKECDADSKCKNFKIGGIKVLYKKQKVQKKKKICKTGR